MLLLHSEVVLNDKISQWRIILSVKLMEDSKSQL